HGPDSVRVRAPGDVAIAPGRVRRPSIHSAPMRLSRLPARLRRPPFRVFGVGIGRSGTTTLARIFSNYRAGHEVGASTMVPLATAVLKGVATDADIRRALDRRRRLQLAVDSAGFLVPLVPQLVDREPSGHFVVTLRDCRSWVRSSIEWEHRSRAMPEHWRT